MLAKQMYQAFYDRVWVEGDLDAIDQFLLPDVNSEGLLTDLSANALDVKEVIRAGRNLMVQIECEVLEAVDADPWYWGLIQIKGRCAATMKPVSISGQVMSKMDNGKLAKVYNNFDFIEFFEALGSLPENTAALLLSGQDLSKLN